MTDSNLVSLIQKLDQDPALASRDLYKVLVTIRTKFMDKDNVLIQNGAIVKLVQHLKRPNSKVVDVVLSILGNLMLHAEARKQIKPHLRVLTSILTSINEENILSRSCRVLANIAQDQENGRALRSFGLLTILVKTLDELKSPKAKATAVRAIRYYGTRILVMNMLLTIPFQDLGVV